MYRLKGFLNSGVGPEFKWHFLRPNYVVKLVVHTLCMCGILFWVFFTCVSISLLTSFRVVALAEVADLIGAASMQSVLATTRE